VPLCANCKQHWTDPIWRYRNRSPHHVAMVLSICSLVAGLVTSIYYPPASATLIVFAVLLWYAKTLLTDFESSRMREGNHSINRFSTYSDVVAKRQVKIIDSCEISVAVCALRMPSGAVFGFGSKQYAAEFNRLDPGTEYL
jgi:hypothetical protein